MEVAQHNEEEIRSMDRGDMVQFQRPVYSHWAVYVGDRHIIHKGGNAQLPTCCSGLCLRTSVHIAQIDNVANNNLLRKNNYLDRKMRPHPSRKIVSKAMSKLGDESYNVFCNNCEHFATWCRYGVPRSMQVSYWCNLCIPFIVFISILTVCIILYLLRSFF